MHFFWTGQNLHILAKKVLLQLDMGSVMLHTKNGRASLAGLGTVAVSIC
jgi:hypothetical protein